MLGACVENVIFPASCLNEFMLSCMCSYVSRQIKNAKDCELFAQSFFCWVRFFGQVKTRARSMEKSVEMGKREKQSKWGNAAMEQITVCGGIVYDLFILLITVIR